MLQFRQCFLRLVKKRLGDDRGERVVATDPHIGRIFDGLLLEPMRTVKNVVAEICFVPQHVIDRLASARDCLALCKFARVQFICDFRPRLLSMRVPKIRLDDLFLISVRERE